MNTYWYLATPYTNYPGGLDDANELACENATLLLKAGIPVFSPIAHSHALVPHGLSAVDHDFWINTVDRPMMRGAHGLIFLEARSWQKSSGMHEEIVEFTKADKPIVFMKPGIIPFAHADLSLNVTDRETFEAALADCLEGARRFHV